MSLKASELRIGNYVDWYGHIITLDGVTTAYLTMCDPLEVIDPSQVDPIPLSEEWLVKFGFDFSHHLPDLDLPSNDVETSSIINYKGIFYLAGPDCPVERTWTPLKIEYVHQLQNLYFALTGSELTIKE